MLRPSPGVTIFCESLGSSPKSAKSAFSACLTVDPKMAVNIDCLGPALAGQNPHRSRQAGVAGLLSATLQRAENGGGTSELPCGANDAFDQGPPPNGDEGFAVTPEP